MILFVSGFNRSGTTVLLEAVAAATGGEAFTVGDLIRHGSPAMAGRLRALTEATVKVDRGVDARPVVESTPEEYAWLLLDHKVTPLLSPKFQPKAAPLLRKVTDEIIARAGVAVLKNPSDTGHEAVLLECFPEARVIVTRRSLAAIHDSSDRALARASRKDLAYGMALTNNSGFIKFLVRVQLTKPGAALMSAYGRWGLRLRTVGVLRRTSRLPIDKVAFLDYDELIDKPEAAAHWAGHIIDARQLAKEFQRSHSFPANPKPAGSLIDRWLDRRWGELWERSRAAQVRRGIVAPPS